MQERGHKGREVCYCKAVGVCGVMVGQSSTALSLTLQTFCERIIGIHVSLPVSVNCRGENAGNDITEFAMLVDDNRDRRHNHC